MHECFKADERGEWYYKKYFKNFKTENIDFWTNNYFTNLRNSRVNVFFYDSTGILENLIYNIPTLAIWPDQYNHINSEFIEKYKLLQDANILFENVDDLIAHLSKFWHNIDEWWMSNKTQELILKFNSQFNNKPSFKSLLNLKNKSYKKKIIFFNMLNSILYLVGNKNKLKIIFIFLIVAIVFVFEFLSLVSIPIYTTALLNTDTTIQKLDPFINDEIKENFLIYSSIFVTAAFLLKNFFLLLSRYVTEKFLTNLKIRLSTSIFNHYFNSKYLEAQKLKPSEMYRDAIPAVTGTHAYITNALSMFTEFGAIIIIFCILITLNAKLTFSLIFIFSIITFLYFKFIKGRLKRKADENQNLTSIFNKNVSETFEALKDIKIYQKKKEVKDKFLTDITKFERNIFFFKVFDTFPKIILELTSIILILGVSLLISIQSNSSKEFIEFLPFLVLVIISCIRLVPAFNAINLSLFYTRVYQASVDNVINQLKRIDENKFQTSTKNNAFKKIFKTNLDIKKNYIVAENLSFSYSDNSYLIKNLNLNISKNSLNAIIGPTGSGKSTLQHILMGFIQPKKEIFF